MAGMATGVAATGAAHCAEQDKYFDPEALERGAKVRSKLISESCGLSIALETVLLHGIPAAMGVLLFISAAQALFNYMSSRCRLLFTNLPCSLFHSRCAGPS